MEVVYYGSRFIFYLSLILMFVGLWRPQVVLWWLAYQNRLKVLKYYGTIALISGALWQAINLF